MCVCVCVRAYVRATVCVCSHVLRVCLFRTVAKSNNIWMTQTALGKSDCR